MDYAYPENDLSDDEKKIICLTSFPDTNALVGEGSIKYLFKFNRCNYCFSFLCSRKNV